MLGKKHSNTTYTLNNWRRNKMKAEEIYSREIAEPTHTDKRNPWMNYAKINGAWYFLLAGSGQWALSMDHVRGDLKESDMKQIY